MEPNIEIFNGIKADQIGDQFLYYGKNLTYVGNHVDFQFYATTHLRRTRKSRGAKRRRVSMMESLRPTAPREIEGEEELKLIFSQAMINCSTAEPIRLHDGYDPIYQVPDTTYSPPRSEVGQIQSVLYVDAEFTMDVGVPYSPIGMGVPHGTPVFNVRATDNEGFLQTATKLFELEEDELDCSPQLVWQLDKYFHLMDLQYSPPKLPFNIPSGKLVYDFDSNIYSSAGFCELSPLSGKHGNEMRETLRGLSNEFFTCVSTLTPKKNQAAGINVTRIYTVLKTVLDILEDNKWPEDGAFGPSRLIIKKKYEIGYLADFHDYLDGIEGFSEHSKKFLTKLRLFWSDSQYRVILDRIMLTPGLDLIKGGDSQTQICAIGCSVVNGTYSNLMRHLDLEPQHLPAKMKDILEKIYILYPDMKKRICSELDFSKYDSLIQAVLILLATAFMCRFPYQDYPGDSLIQKMIHYLTSVASTQNSYRYAYIPYFAVLFYFQGRVPSGSLATSVIDSIAQIILRFLFMDIRIDELLAAGHIVLAHKCYLTRWYLLVALIYGDDRTESMPECVYDQIGLHAFKDWLKENFRWQVKFIIPDPEKGDPIDLYPSGTGEVRFVTKGRFAVLISDIPSPSFLKTRLVRVFLDGKYLGTYPFRSTEDLLCKMVGSLSALDNPIKWLCSLSSLGYLSIGNLEVFSIVRRVYYNYLQYLQKSEEDIKIELTDLTERYREFPGEMKDLPNSMRRAIIDGAAGYFPEWSHIVEKHNIGTRLHKKVPRTFEDQIVGKDVGKMFADPVPFEQLQATFTYMCENYPQN